MLTALITGSIGLIGVFLGFRGSLHLQKRNARADQRRQITDVAQETLAAAGELETAVTIYHVQWLTWRSTWPTLGIAAADFLAAGRDWTKAAPAALRAANQLRRDREEAARVALHQPSARLTNARIAASLPDEPQLRASADDLRQAVAGLLPPARKAPGSTTTGRQPSHPDSGVPVHRRPHSPNSMTPSRACAQTPQVVVELRHGHHRFFLTGCVSQMSDRPGSWAHAASALSSAWHG
jgi:hypothetical protein